MSIYSIEIRTSPIEGLGMFASEPIGRGERVRRIRVEREITADAPLREDRGERLDHCDYPDGKVVLLGYPDRHVNHSCDPNCFVLYEPAGAFLVARREIGRGEEITCDYNINISGGTAWSCHCGAARCRGTVAGDFFKLPPEIQWEYRPLLAAWFVRRHADRFAATGMGDERKMSDERMAHETKGVTVTLLATVDLGPEIEGMAGRQLRMRMVTFEPGAVFGPVHDHKGRPGTVYILQGTITDHRDGVATDYGPGVGWPEDRNTLHWLENRGAIPAVEISVDIVRQE